MNFEDLREYCLRKPFVTEGFPFDSTTMVFKVGNKIFVLTNIDNFTSINLKADPEKAIDQRERFLGVESGYHMNKKHWNTVRVDMDVSIGEIKEMIDDSYNLVFSSLSKKQRNELEVG